MTVSFDDVPFGVITTDASLPLPAREDGTGVYYYAITAILRSREDYLGFQDLFSVATILPAMGALDMGTAVVERGPGLRTLIYPDGSDELEVDAILISVVPKGRSLDQIGYLCDARFFIAQAII